MDSPSATVGCDSIARDGDENGSDSDASHASMPDLIPVSPQRCPSPEVSPRTGSRLRRTGRGGPLGRGRDRGRLLLDRGALLPARSLFASAIHKALGVGGGAVASGDGGLASGQGTATNTKTQPISSSTNTSAGTDAESGPRPESSAEDSEASRGTSKESEEVPQAPLAVAAKPSEKPAPFSFSGSAKAASAGFGQRANALAAALDQLGGSGLAQDQTSSTTPTVMEILAHKCAPHGASVDDVEISREARHRFQASCNMDMELAGVFDSDSDEDDAGGCESGKEKKQTGVAKSEDNKNGVTPAAGEPKHVQATNKRRRKTAAILKDRPPGAPSADLAAPIVEAASAAAAAASKEDHRNNAGVSCGAGEPPAGFGDASFGKSFGPRFKGLSPTALQAARSSWTLHSLADVRQASSQDNQRAAAACLAELQSRRCASDNSGTNGSSDFAGSKEPAVASKPVFRRPPPRSASKAPTEDPIDVARTTIEASVTGVRTMEACVVGTTRRRNSSDAVQSTAENAAALADSAPPSKRRRRQLSLSLDEDPADAE